MNYRIFLNGYRFSTYDDCIKLLIYSAEQSDYIVEIEGFEKTTPFDYNKFAATNCKNNQKEDIQSE